MGSGRVDYQESSNTPGNVRTRPKHAFLASFSNPLIQKSIDGVYDDLEINYTPLHWASECNISSLCMTEIPAGVASSEFQLYNTYLTESLVIETAIICQISWISQSAKWVNLMFQKQPDTLHFVAEIN